MVISGSLILLLYCIIINTQIGHWPSDRLLQDLSWPRTLYSYMYSLTALLYVQFSYLTCNELEDEYLILFFSLWYRIISMSPRYRIYLFILLVFSAFNTVLPPQARGGGEGGGPGACPSPPTGSSSGSRTPTRSYSSPSPPTPAPRQKSLLLLQKNKRRKSNNMKKGGGPCTFFTVFRICEEFSQRNRLSIQHFA
jgi:hypothetical protein